MIWTSILRNPEGGFKMNYSSFNLKKDIKASLNYLVYTPKSYTENSQWPLIVSLHGVGECGDNLEKVKKYGIHKVLKENDDFPFIVVSPQCPENELWEMQFNLLEDLLEEIKKKYSIDEKRMYLTGFSMGGYGTWNFATLRPNIFAAIAPICGGVILLHKTLSLKNVPIWVAHGDKDTAVEIEESRRVVNYLKPHNPNIVFKVYEGCGHEVCSTAYEDPEMFEWLLKQRNKY